MTGGNCIRGLHRLPEPAMYTSPTISDKAMCDEPAFCGRVSKLTSLTSEEHKWWHWPSWQAEQNTWRSSRTSLSGGPDWCSSCDHLVHRCLQLPKEKHKKEKKSLWFKDLNETERETGQEWLTAARQVYLSLPARVPCQTFCECG